MRPQDARLLDNWIDGHSQPLALADAIRPLSWTCFSSVSKIERNAPGAAGGDGLFYRRRAHAAYVLFFIHLDSRRVGIAGITIHPDEVWMQQMPRNVTMEGGGILRDCRCLLHDRDTKYPHSFRAIIASRQVEPLTLPARCPNLNAYAERWVRSVKEECLSKVILLGECSLRRALK